MCEDQEEDSTLVDREGGRGEALPVAGFIRSTGGVGGTLERAKQESDRI